MYRKDLRPDIADAFIQEFNIDGPKLTLDNVASRMHISKKTIYRFFRCKDDIYVYSASCAAEKVREAQLQVIGDSNRSTKQKIIDLFAIPAIRETRIDVAKLYLLAQDSPHVIDSFFLAFQSSREALEKVLVQAQEEGVVRPDRNISLVSGFLLGALQRLCTYPLLEETRTSYLDAIRILADTVLFGLID